MLLSSYDTALQVRELETRISSLAGGGSLICKFDQQMFP
jgi:hypothetical protein